MKLFCPRLAAIVACIACGGSGRAQQLDLDESNDGVCRYILDGWIAAQGNATGGYGIYSYETVEEVELNNGTPKLTVHIVETSAGHVRIESSSPEAGALIQAYDGRIGWRSHGPWGIGPMSKGDIQSLLTQARLDTARGTIRAYAQYTLLPPETRNGRPCYVLGASGRQTGEEKWFFDKRNHELVEIDRPTTGNSPGIQMYFSDFGPTGGLVFPYTIRIVGGKSGITIHRLKLLINPPVDESSFVLTMGQLHEINAVAAILERHASVYGVDENGSASRSRVVHWSIDSSASGLREQATISFRPPHLVRYEVDTAGMGKTLEVSDGQWGWMSSDVLGFHWLKPAEIATVMSQANSYKLPRLADAFPLRKLVGERIVNGRHAVAVALATFAGPDGTYYFDQAAGRLLRYVPPRPKDPAGTVIDFSDFRVVAGIEIPFVTTVSNFAGQTVARLQSIENDVPLADDLFTPPPAGH